MQVSFAAQGEQNEKVQQQFAQAENMFKAAAFAGGPGTSKGFKIRMEDCNIEKSKESIDVVDVRQWVRTFDLSLEAHYFWTFADLVVQTIRHEKAPITHSTFADFIVEMNKDEELRDGVQSRLQPLDWDFDEKMRLLYRYFIPKLSKNL